MRVVTIPAIPVRGPASNRRADLCTHYFQTVPLPAAEVNKWRNKLTHAGSEADSRKAHLCAYFVARCISELHRVAIVSDDVEPEILNYAGILASRVPEPPDWVPE